MSAIILDGNLKSSLSAVRSLGKKGIRFSVGATRATALSLHSRYAKEVFLYASPYKDQEHFIERVKWEAKRLGDNPVIFAFSDATLLTIYQYREAFAGIATIAFPSVTSMDIAFDKAATYSLAHVSGVPVIPTYTPVTKDELKAVAQKLKYPAILKVRQSVTWGKGSGIFGSVTFTMHEEDLVNKFFELRTVYGDTILIQEVIYGEEYGVEMLVQKGVVYAEVVHRRIRSLSPTGGASVVKETLTDQSKKEQLVTYARILVEKLSWEGPIMVEFKEDRSTGDIYLMEINGRFWGSLPLSVAAGVDMPYLYYEAMKGNIPSSVVMGTEGIVTRHFLGDIVHLCKVLFDRNPIRKFLYPKRGATIVSFFSSFARTKSDVWSFEDPKPACMEIIDAIVKHVAS